MPCLPKGLYHKISNIRSSSNNSMRPVSSHSYSNSTNWNRSHEVQKFHYIGMCTILRNREEQRFKNSISQVEKKPFVIYIVDRISDEKNVE